MKFVHSAVHTQRGISHIWQSENMKCLRVQLSGTREGTVFVSYFRLGNNNKPLYNYNWLVVPDWILRSLKHNPDPTGPIDWILEANQNLTWLHETVALAFTNLAVSQPLAPSTLRGESASLPK